MSWARKMRCLFAELNIGFSDFAVMLPEFAEQCKVVLEGNANPTDDCLNAICECFDVNPVWLNIPVLSPAAGSVSSKTMSSKTISSTPVSTEENRNGGEESGEENSEHCEEDAPILLSRRWVRSSEDEIRERVLELRGEQTTAEFADRTGLSLATLENYFSGRTNMSDRIIIRLIETLDISREWLIYGVEIAREHPLNTRMKTFLLSHPEARKVVKALMKMEEDEKAEQAEKAAERLSRREQDMKTAEWFREMRVKSGLNQREFAEELCVSPAMVSHIETGRRGVSDELREKIEKMSIGA